LSPLLRPSVAGTTSVDWPPRRWLLLALLYFGAHLVLRVLVADGLELDEAEQALWTQQLALGYGMQPPLYTWLQWGLFQVFGVSIFALALLKSLLLLATYLFAFLAAREAMAPPLAALAAASMLLLPEQGWEAQRDLTHSVISTTAAAAALWLALALQRQRRWASYLGLGLALGLGVLGKYSFALFALALVGALALGSDTRAVVLDRRFLVSLAVAALVLLPHGLWLAGHWAQVGDATLAKVGSGGGTLPWGSRVLAALGSLPMALLSFVGPLWLVAAALFLRRGNGPCTALSAQAALLGRTLGVVGLLLLAIALTGRVGHYKARWMLPLLFAMPLALFAAAPALATHPRLPWLRRIVLATALLIVVLIALRAPWYAWRGRPDEWNLPAAALAQALRDAGYRDQPITTPNRVLGGVLRMQFPHSVVRIGREAPPGPSLWIEPAASTRPEGMSEVVLAPRYASVDTPPLRWQFVLRH
jgi:4-amino-4-deoxy-L-arabinose transferase-like glycosyltransferase